MSVEDKEAQESETRGEAAQEAREAPKPRRRSIRWAPAGEARLRATRHDAHREHFARREADGDKRWATCPGCGSPFIALTDDGVRISGIRRLGPEFGDRWGDAPVCSTYCFDICTLLGTYDAAMLDAQEAVNSMLGRIVVGQIATMKKRRIEMAFSRGAANRVDPSQYSISLTDGQNAVAIARVRQLRVIMTALVAQTRRPYKRRVPKSGVVKKQVNGEE